MLSLGNRSRITIFLLSVRIRKSFIESSNVIPRRSNQLNPDGATKASYSRRTYTFSVHHIPNRKAFICKIFFNFRFMVVLPEPSGSIIQMLRGRIEIPVQ